MGTVSAVQQVRGELHLPCCLCRVIASENYTVSRTTNRSVQRKGARAFRKKISFKNLSAAKLRLVELKKKHTGSFYELGTKCERRRKTERVETVHRCEPACLIGLCEQEPAIQRALLQRSLTVGGLRGEVSLGFKANTKQ
jgi:hypothetical protein